MFSKILGSKTPTLIIGGGFILFFIYSEYTSNYNLKKYSKVSVAKVVGISRSGSANFIDYVYYINKKKYEDSQYLRNKCGKCKIGKYFKLEYSYKDPKINKLIFNQEINDSIMISEAGFLAK